MRIHYWLIASFCLLIAFGVACSDSSTRANAMSDEELEKAINARIDEDPQLRPYDIGVDVDGDENKVTLTGDVPSEGLRQKAVAAAKEAGRNLVVTDKIDVKPGDVARTDYTEEMARTHREEATRSGETVGDTVDDAWIHTKIRTKLAGKGEFPTGGINVDVMNNVVTLRGSVESQAAKMEAERLARETDGVAQVKNQIVVKKGE
jgi:hyperosmotically inducible protein